MQPEASARQLPDLVVSTPRAGPAAVPGQALIPARAPTWPCSSRVWDASGRASGDPSSPDLGRGVVEIPAVQVSGQGKGNQGAKTRLRAVQEGERGLAERRQSRASSSEGPFRAHARARTV